MFFDNSFSQLLSSTPWFVVLIYVVLAITLIVNIVKAVRRWNFNRTQPVLTRAAEAVAKTTDVTSGIRGQANKNVSDNAMYRYAQVIKYYLLCGIKIRRVIILVTFDLNVLWDYRLYVL